MVPVVSDVSMCNQNVKVYDEQPAGRLTVWLSVSVCVTPYPSSQAFQEPECAACDGVLSPTPAVALHGAAVPVSKPGLPSFWPGLEHPPPDGLIVHVKVVLPLCPPLVAVAVTVNVPAVVGVPTIRPVPELMARPGGRPVADHANVPFPPDACNPSWVWVPTVPVWLPGLVTVTPPVPPPMIGWLISQPPVPLLKSLDHIDCIAKLPVEKATFAEAPWPDVIHAHLSPFSKPVVSVQPPGGVWSVIVSEYSCPSTIVTPSSVPALPPLTKFMPQLEPASVTYGMFVNAMSPTDELTGPPGSVVSPVPAVQAP